MTKPSFHHMMQQVQVKVLQGQVLVLVQVLELVLELALV
jgi:hypothetical protein